MAAISGSPVRLDLLAIAMVSVGLVVLIGTGWLGVTHSLYGALAGMVLAGLVIRRGRDRKRLARWLLWALLALLVPIPFALCEPVIAAVLTVWLVLPLVLFFAVSHALALLLFTRCRDRSREALDSLLLLLGALLSLVCVGAWLVVDNVMVCDSPDDQELWQTLTLVVMPAGPAAGAWALGSMIRRRIWLERVRAGKVRGWSVVPWSADRFERPIRPLFSGERPPFAVVVRHRPAADPRSPYRGPEGVEDLEPYSLIAAAGPSGPGLQ